MSIAAYFTVHHIELLLDAPLDFSRENFHISARAPTEGAGSGFVGGAGGGGGGCLCLDAIIGACHDWARGQQF